MSKARITLFILSGIILLVTIYLVFLKPERQEVLYPEWLGKEVVFPKELRQLEGINPIEINNFLESNKDNKKIISIIDASCAKCIMGQLNKIDSLFSEIAHRGNKTIMVFVINFYERDFDNFMLTLYPLIKSKAVIIWDRDYFFETKNDLFTPNLNGRTFMLNVKNEIILVGSPLFGGQGILAQYEKLVKNGD